MSWDTTTVLTIFLITIGLLASNRVRIDVIGLIVMALLGITGVVQVSTLYAGFSSEAVILIAGMLALGESLVAAGTIAWIGRLMAKVGGNRPNRLAFLLMTMASIPSAFISDVGLVGMFLPVVRDLNRRTHVRARRLLMPLAVGATLGGLLTMVGSAGNIVANTALTSEGFPPLSLFSVTPMALLLLVVGILFMSALGRVLLPTAHGMTVPLESKSEVLRQYITDLTVPDESALIGHTLGSVHIFKEQGITLVRVLRNGQSLPVRSSLQFQAHDSLLVLGDVQAITAQDHRHYGLSVVDEREEDTKARTEGSAHVEELLIGHRSPWNGKTLVQLDLRNRLGLNVLGLYREGQLLYRRISTVALRVGDIVLIQGTSEQFDALHREHGFIPLNELTIKPTSRRYGVYLAPLILLSALFLAAFNVLTIQTAIISAIVVMAFAKLLNPSDAYRAIEWRIVVFVAGMIPLSQALIKEGITADVVRYLVMVSHFAAGHWFMILILFVASALLTQILSNIATVLVLGPVAAELATRLGVYPDPFVVAVMVAVSASPLTPLANKVDVLIMGPGGYRYGDFLRFGLPFTALMAVVCTIIIPWFFPFH